MKVIRRRRPIPADVAEALGVADQRVLAWSPLVGGGAVAATPEGLRILTPRGRPIARPWLEVDHAVWEPDSRMLAVWWVGTRQATPLEVEDVRGRLPEVIRERVQSSVVLSMPVALPDGRVGRVALRKDAAGTLVVQASLPPGVRADVPPVRELVEQAEAALRAEAGAAVNPAALPPL